MRCSVEPFIDSFLSPSFFTIPSTASHLAVTVQTPPLEIQRAPDQQPSHQAQPRPNAIQVDVKPTAVKLEEMDN